MPQVRIGTSGWSYPGWNDRFYPTGLPRRSVLAYNASRFNSVELNGSFYSLQRPSSYRQWYTQTPRKFVFALKGSRFITHNKKLKDAETPLANFLASGILVLEEKLGPIVWQLPATARFDADRLAEFFESLPYDTEAAAALARRHAARVDGRCWTDTSMKRRIRHAIEVRSDRFRVPEFARLVRRYGIAVVVSDAAGWARLEEATTDFVYLRLHGSARTYASRYSDAELDAWAERIARWRDGGEPSDARRITDEPPKPRRRGRDVYVYFDNDYEANAPNDAQRLAERVSPNPPVITAAASIDGPPMRPRTPRSARRGADEAAPSR